MICVARVVPIDSSVGWICALSRIQESLGMIQEILSGFTSFLRRNNTASMAVLPAPTMTKSSYFLLKMGRSFKGAHLASPSREKGGGLLEGTTTFM